MTCGASSPTVQQRVSTTDPGEADGFMQADTRFRADPDEREGFEFTLEAASAGSFIISTIRHTVRLQARAAEPPELMTAPSLNAVHPALE